MKGASAGVVPMECLPSDCRGMELQSPAAVMRSAFAFAAHSLIFFSDSKISRDISLIFLSPT